MPHHHIIVNDERLVLSHLPKRGEAPPLDEVGAGEQCDDCGYNVVDTLEYVTARKMFVCSTCHSEYPVRDGGYIDT